LKDTIDAVVKEFISKICEKYELDTSELELLWNGEEIVSKPKVEKKEKKVEKKEKVEKSTVEDPESLLKCNKNELIALCKTHGHKCTGTKDVLISRLLGKEEETVKPAKKTASKSKAKAVLESTPVVKKLTANIPNIIIRNNKFKNLEHADTGLIFNKDTKTVIGKQNANGSIDELTEADIDTCNAYKFTYDMPKNLDKKSTLDDVKVEELDEELGEDDIETVEEIEEEEEDEGEEICE